MDAIASEQRQHRCAQRDNAGASHAPITLQRKHADRDRAEKYAEASKYDEEIQQQAKCVPALIPLRGQGQAVAENQEQRNAAVGSIGSADERLILRSGEKYQRNRYIRIRESAEEPVLQQQRDERSRKDARADEERFRPRVPVCRRIEETIDNQPQTLSMRAVLIEE